MEAVLDQIPDTEPLGNEIETATGLAYGTTYYVFYADPFLAGGAVTYLEDTSKTTTLSSPNNFFAGSITTPLAGGSDTIGNNDGGVGAQGGAINLLFPSDATTSTVGAGTVTDANNALDIDDSNYAELSIPGNGGNNQAQLLITGPPGFRRGFSSVTLTVMWSLPVNSITPASGFTSIITVDSGNGTPSLGSQLYAYGVGPFSTPVPFNVDIPPNINISLLRIFSSVQDLSGQTGGVMTMRVHSVKILATE